MTSKKVAFIAGVAVGLLLLLGSASPAEKEPEALSRDREPEPVFDPVLDGPAPGGSVEPPPTSRVPGSDEPSETPSMEPPPDPGHLDENGELARGKSPLSPSPVKKGHEAPPKLSGDSEKSLESFVQDYEEQLEQNDLTPPQAAAAALVYYHNNHGADPDFIRGLQEQMTPDPQAASLKATGKYDDATARAIARVLKPVEKLARETAGIDFDGLLEGGASGHEASAEALRIYFLRGGTDWRIIAKIQERLAREDSSVRVDGMMGPLTLGAIDRVFPDRGSDVKREDDFEGGD